MLKTERLRIRRFHESDLEDFELLIRDKMSSKYAPYDIPWPVDNFGDILVCLINDDAWHAVELIEKSKVIGFVVTIHSAYQNKGYAYEASCAFMDYFIKECGIKKFTSGTADCNKPSVALLNKLGFTKVQSLETSFANDSQGNPITFLASIYERMN